jgi:hypothetical protein
LSFWLNLLFSLFLWSLTSLPIFLGMVFTVNIVFGVTIGASNADFLIAAIVIVAFGVGDDSSCGGVDILIVSVVIVATNRGGREDIVFFAIVIVAIGVGGAGDILVVAIVIVATSVGDGGVILIVAIVTVASDVSCDSDVVIISMVVAIDVGDKGSYGGGDDLVCIWKIVAICGFDSKVDNIFVVTIVATGSIVVVVSIISVQHIFVILFNVDRIAITKEVKVVYFVTMKVKLTILVLLSCYFHKTF